MKNKTDVKIAYITEFDKYGYCYKQRIKLPSTVWNDFLKSINEKAKSLPIGVSNLMSIYLLADVITKDNKRFINLTQAGELYQFLLDKGYDVKRFNLDCNSYVVIY